IDQSLIGRILDTLPIRLELVGLEKIGQGAQQRFAVDLFLALAGNEIVGERLIVDAALPIQRTDRQFFLDTKAGDPGELDQVAAVAALGELGEAAEAADAKQIWLVLIGARMRRIG